MPFLKTSKNRPPPAKPGGRFFIPLISFPGNDPGHIFILERQLEVVVDPMNEKQKIENTTGAFS
jgi:hypothetical protein